MYDESKWPRFTCVASFLYEALRQYDVVIDKRKLAQALKIRVPREIENPFDLETTDNPLDFGLSLTDAIVTINNILSENLSGIVFRHIRLSSIPYRMFAETYKELHDAGAIVGVGLDFKMINKSDISSKHLCFISSLNEADAELLDYYDNVAGLKYSVKSSNLVSNVLGIDDGFWVIGDSKQISTSIIK